MSLKDKVSIVTGAAKGIGEGIAQKLGEHGSKIICFPTAWPNWDNRRCCKRLLISCF